MIWFVSILILAVLTLLAGNKSKRNMADERLKIASIGKGEKEEENDFFFYEYTKPNKLKNGSWNKKGDVSALFIHSEILPVISRPEYRKDLRVIAQHTPVLLLGARKFNLYSLLHTNLSYEEILAQSSPTEYIQLTFSFANGDDCFFQTDGFHYHNQKEIYQAIHFMQLTDTYSHWQRFFYEY